MSKRGWLLAGRFLLGAALLGGWLMAVRRLPANEATQEQRQELDAKALALFRQGFTLFQRGDHSRAVPPLREALAILRQLPKDRPQGRLALGRTLTVLGLCLGKQGQYVEAERCLREALDIDRELHSKKKDRQSHMNLAATLIVLGELLRQRGAYDKAEGPCREALAAHRQLFPKEKYPRGHRYLATSLNNLGAVLVGRSQYAEAERLLYEALDMRRALFPKKDFPRGHPQVATTLNNLAGLFEKQGKHARAAPLFREVLDTCRALYPKDKYPHGHPMLSATLDNLGNLLAKQGDSARAEPLLREAVIMDRTLYPRERFPRGHPQLAGSLTSWGNALRKQGELDKAEPPLREALTMYRTLFPKGKYPQGHPTLATSLLGLGLLLQERGEYAGAESLYREALAMHRSLYPREKYPHGQPDLATNLDNLAAVLLKQGLYAEAGPLSLEGLRIDRALYPKEKFPHGHADLAYSLNNRGFLLTAQGEYAEAEALYREALRMGRALSRASRRAHPTLIASLTNLGNLFMAQGEYARAETHYKEALDLCRALFPREKYPQGHRIPALLLNSLALLCKKEGEYAGAERLSRQAVKMGRALYPREKYPNGHPDLATCLGNLGFLLLEQDKAAEGETLCREALEMRRAFYPKSKYPHGHRELADSLLGLGGSLYVRGEIAKASLLLREALAMYRALYPETTFPQGHPDLSMSLNSLGALLMMQKEYAKAAPLLRQGLRMDRTHLRRLAEVSPEAQALNFASTFPLTYSGYLSLTRRLPVADVYEEMWQSKALLSRILERRHLDLLASKDDETRRIGRRLAAVRQRLSRLLLALATDPKEHTRRLDRLTQDKEELEKRLGRQLRLTAPGAFTQTSPKDLAVALAALPAKTVFIDLVRYTDFEWDPERRGSKAARRTSRYAAFILRPDRKTAERVELGPAEPIERAWLTWRQTIVGGRPDRPAAARFARLTWEPLRKQLPADVQTIYLSGDDVLAQVPWAALPGTESGSVLLEKHAIAYVPHGPWLLEQLKRKPRPRAADDLLVVAGGIAYDRAPALVEKAPVEGLALRAPPVGGRRVVWKELPGTAREHEQIVALARKLFRKPPLSRSGAAAGTVQLQEDLPKVRYAHLATHGFFADPQFRSAFQVDENQYRFVTIDRRTAGARSPLVLSGLVLAGANRQGKEAVPDRGILTAEALVGLRLDDMELAVLSACDTGRGDFRVAGGEGVYGLQRAFHLAGCHNVIASLWRVDDDATAALMGVFYRKLWVDKLPPLEALRQAQLYLYRNPSAVAALAKRRGDLFAEVDLPKETIKPGAAAKHAPTSQWAAFVLSGTGR